MPTRSNRPCNHPGCAAYQTRHGYCEAHQRVGWQPARERGTRQQRGYGARWERLRAAVMRRDDYLCQSCYRQGNLTPAKDVDHIRPKSKGGADSLENLQALCRDCHKAKTIKERGNNTRRTRAV